MRRKINGYVLLTVLVYLQLFGLLAITNITSSILLQKNIKSKKAVFMRRNDALMILSELAKLKPQCVKPVYSPALLNQQPLDFWHESACRGDKHYFYFMNDLGVDECSILNTDEGRGLSVRYYLLTLAVDEAAVIVQESIAVSSHIQANCKHEPREVTPGRQGLRWLR